MVTTRITIQLKEGVADPEGQNTKKALKLLGFEGINEVRSMKLFEVDMAAGAEEALKRSEEMCRKLLANPVIQDYSIELK